MPAASAVSERSFSAMSRLYTIFAYEYVTEQIEQHDVTSCTQGENRCPEIGKRRKRIRFWLRTPTEAVWEIYGYRFAKKGRPS